MNITLKVYHDIYIGLSLSGLLGFPLYIACSEIVVFSRRFCQIGEDTLPIVSVRFLPSLKFKRNHPLKNNQSYIFNNMPQRVENRN